MTVQVREFLKRAETLSVSDQLSLAVLLIERARNHTPRPVATERKWMDVAGVASYPLTGEDAQQWVSRTRQEGDDERERQWRPAA